MDLLKKNKDKFGKKLPPPRPMDVYYFCNACGSKFKVERADARFCCDLCRSAAFSVAKNIITVPHTLTADDAIRYDSIVLKLKDDSGKVERVLFEKDGDGIFNRIKNELKRTGDKEKDEAVEKETEGEEELKMVAKEGAKIKKAPKNDKHLIPGKKNSKGLPIKKKGGED